jgi:hypothetical protein
VPASAQVESLKDVATAKGLDASYAQPWELPTTAIEAYPATGEGKPGMAPGYPADPKIFVPHSGAATKTTNPTNTPHAAPAAPAGN